MDENIKSLFVSYLEKNISKEDEKILLQWIKDNPEALKEFWEIRRLWNLSGWAGEMNQENIESEWKALLTKIKNTRPVSRIVQFWYWLPRIAAVFIFGVVCSQLFNYFVDFNTGKKLVYQEITAPKGSKSKISLPDGSTIWLNAGSSIKYSNEFGFGKREVFLTGEAYFDVVSDKSKVFIVEASDLMIKAYGTSFNVKSYPEENTVEATLIKGSIGVKRIGSKNKKNDEVILEPNQRVVYYRPSGQTEEVGNEDDLNLAENKQITEVTEPRKLTYMITKGIDPVPFTSWKEGVLVINSETLGELAAILERKYDMKIHFESEKLKELKFTGSLKNETIEQVIEAIGIAAHINYKIDKRDIWLSDIKSN